MLERDIEKALVKRITALGGTCEKFTSPARRSVPDRIVCLPGGVVEFVELKAPGKKPTEKQERDHQRRRALGCVVRVVDSLEGIDNAYPL
jgi:hypothetical protein